MRFHAVDIIDEKHLILLENDQEKNQKKLDCFYTFYTLI
jgi:hypothetical protein